MSNQTLFVKRLSEFATIPVRASSGAAGYDLSAAYDSIVMAHGKTLIATDLSIAVPANTYGRIALRSGLAHKHFIDVGAGVIDSDYRGNVCVLLFNHSSEIFHVKAGDRIAQLILEHIIMAEVIEVNDLTVTNRNTDGFGSTGI